MENIEIFSQFSLEIFLVLSLTLSMMFMLNIAHFYVFRTDILCLKFYVEIRNNGFLCACINIPWIHFSSSNS